jgi:hypothetical protein
MMAALIKSHDRNPAFLTNGHCNPHILFLALRPAWLKDIFAVRMYHSSGWAGKPTYGWSKEGA